MELEEKLYSLLSVSYVDTRCFLVVLNQSPVVQWQENASAEHAWATVLNPLKEITLAHPVCFRVKKKECLINLRHFVIKHTSHASNLPNQRVLSLDKIVDYLLRFFGWNRVEDTHQLRQYPAGHAVYGGCVQEVRIYLTTNMSDTSIISDLIKWLKCTGNENT